MIDLDYETAFWVCLPFAAFAFFFLASRLGKFMHDVDEDASNSLKKFRKEHGRHTP